MSTEGMGNVGSKGSGYTVSTVASPKERPSVSRATPRGPSPPAPGVDPRVTVQELKWLPSPPSEVRHSLTALMLLNARAHEEDADLHEEGRTPRGHLEL